MEKNVDSIFDECILLIKQKTDNFSLIDGQSLMVLGEKMEKYGKALYKSGREKRKTEKRQAKKGLFYHGSSQSSPYANYTKYTNSVQSPMPQSFNDEVLVLFVQADGGKTLLMEIAGSMHLCSELSEELYFNVTNIWMGTNEEFNKFFAEAFNLGENRGNTALLDFVMLKIELRNQYEGLRMGMSSLERMNAIGKLCDDNVRISEISNRLNFGVINGKELIWEK